MFQRQRHKLAQVYHDDERPGFHPEMHHVVETSPGCGSYYDRKTDTSHVVHLTEHGWKVVSSWNSHGLGDPFADEEMFTTYETPTQTYCYECGGVCNGGH
jgi:hypothetical protein